ncbi:MAG: hypothetical protein U1E10_17900 [Bdellovibrionales bacterium]|nr:hypothetical protein [Bdellovibrionales bacterium]
MAAGDQHLGNTKSTSGSFGKTGTSSHKDTLWLVKSGDRVLGPFATSEVVRRLRSKELVVIDEVIAPQSRWRHIRDEALFSNVVDEIRTGLMSVRDDTEVGESGGAETITARSSEDRTPQIPVEAAATNAKFDGTLNRISDIADAEIVSETNDREVIHQASAREVSRESSHGKGGKTSGGKGSSSAPKTGGVHSTLSYAPPSGREVDKSSYAVVSKTSRVLWLVVGVAILILGASFYLFKIAPIKRAAVRAQEVAALRVEADRAWNRGEFVRALKLYDQIGKEPHVDMEPDLRAAILKLRVERETLAAKRQLEELLPRLGTSEAKSRAKIALAISSLQADEPLEAQNSLSRLVREPESGPIAYFNLAVAQAASGLRPDAIQNLRKLDSHPTLGAPSKLLRAMLHLKDGQARPAANAVEIDEIKTVGAFRQELLAVGAIADWLDGNKKRSAVRLKMALETDPFQTEEFFYDPLLYFEILRWKQILPLAKDFAGRVKTNSAKALYALALIKSDRRPEAAGLIAESLSSKNNDPDLQAVNAYGLMTQSRDDEARGLLRFTKPAQGEAPVITMILEARLCERAGDAACSDAQWMKLTKTDSHASSTIAAQVSVARAESKIASDRTMQAVERLKMLYSNSIPVIKLHDEVIANRSEAVEATP